MFADIISIGGQAGREYFINRIDIQYFVAITPTNSSNPSGVTNYGVDIYLHHLTSPFRFSFANKQEHDIAIKRLTFGN